MSRLLMVPSVTASSVQLLFFPRISLSVTQQSINYISLHHSSYRFTSSSTENGPANIPNKQSNSILPRTLNTLAPTLKSSPNGGSVIKTKRLSTAELENLRINFDLLKECLGENTHQANGKASTAALLMKPGTRDLHRWLYNEAGKVIPRLNKLQITFFISRIHTLQKNDLVDNNLGDRLAETMKPYITSWDIGELTTAKNVVLGHFKVQNLEFISAVRRQEIEVLSTVTDITVQDIVQLVGSSFVTSVKNQGYQKLIVKKLSEMTNDMQPKDIYKCLELPEIWGIQLPQYVSKLYGRAIKVLDITPAYPLCHMLDSCVKLKYRNVHFIEAAVGRFKDGRFVSRMEPECVALALHALITLQYTPQWCMNILVRESKHAVSHMDPQSIYLLIKVLNKGFRRDQVLVDRVVKRAGELASSFNTEQIGDVINTLDMLRTMDSQTLTAFLCRSVNLADSLDERSLGVILQVYVNSKHKGINELFPSSSQLEKALFHRVHTVLPYLSIASVTQILRALDMLKYDDASLLEELGKRLTTLSPHMTPAQSGIVLSALPNLGLVTPSVLKAVMARISQLEANLSGKDAALVANFFNKTGLKAQTSADLLSRLCHSHNKNLDINAICALIPFFAKHRTNDMKTMDILTNRIQALRSNITPFDLSKILGAAATANIHNGVLITSLSAQFLELFSTKGMASPIVATSFSALARGRVYDQKLLNTIVSWCRAINPGDLSAHNASLILHSLGMLNCEGKINEIVPILVSYIVDNTAQVNQSVALQEEKSQLHNMQEKRMEVLCRALWAVCVLTPKDIGLHETLWDTVIATLMDPLYKWSAWKEPPIELHNNTDDNPITNNALDNNSITGNTSNSVGKKHIVSPIQKSLIELHLSYKATNLRFPALLLRKQRKISKDVTSVFTRAAQTWDEIVVNDKERVHEIQRQVSHCLNISGFTLQDNTCIAPSQIKADIVLADEKMVVETNGPNRYVITGDRQHPTGPTQLKRSLIEASGYKVTTIPWWEWELANTTERRVGYLRKKMSGGRDSIGLKEEEKQESSSNNSDGRKDDNNDHSFAFF